MNAKRVAIFIDNSNVFHHIKNLRKIDPEWVSLYDPEKLANRLAGDRKTVFINFYCTPPPLYLLSGQEKERKKYSSQTRYFSAIEKNKNVAVKYGTLTGPAGQESEKNLDTQLVTDLVAMAALNKYDTAVIVSNDGDYVSAAEKAITLFKRRVEVAYFKGGLPMDLKRVCTLTRRLRRSYFTKINFN